MDQSKYLVFGATGERGRSVIDELSHRGAGVVAVARTEAAAAELRRREIDVVVGDLETAPIPDGIAAIHVPLPAAVDPNHFVANGRTIVDRLAGVDAHVAFGMPSIVPTSPTGVAVPDSRLEVTSLIRRELPAATIVTTTLLLENFSQALRPAIEQGAIPYPISQDVPVAWVANRDLGDAIAACLLDDTTAGSILHFGGRDVMTGPELTDVIAGAVDRRVDYAPISQGDFAAALSPFLGESVGGAIAEMTVWAGTEGAELLTPTEAHLHRLDDHMRLGRTPVSDWVAGAFASRH